MSYVLAPAGDAERTRLLLKVVTPRGRLIAPLLSVGDLIMARRQLLPFISKVHWSKRAGAAVLARYARPTT